MSEAPMRALFCTEARRLADQIDELQRTIVAGQPCDPAMLERLSRRWLALKSAAVVMEAVWLVRLAEAVGLRLQRALDSDLTLGREETEALPQALALVQQAATGTGWDDAQAHAATASRALLGVLGVKRQPAQPESAAPAPDAKAARLHELLKQEAAEQVATMQRLLLDLDSQPEQAHLLDALMRAAHSLKGAARAAQVTPAVQLAHAFEDHLAAIQRGERAHDSAGTDLGLRVTDQLLALVQRDDAVGLSEVDAATAALLSALADAGQAPPVAAPAPSSAPAPATPSPDDRSASALKVSAQAVNAMLAMAAQQLVEIDRLRSLAGGARDLRLDARLLHHELDDLCRVLRDVALPPEVAERVAALRNRMRQNRRRLGDHGEHLQAIVSQNEQLVQRLYRTAAQVRLRPLRERLVSAPRLVHDLARQLGKQVKLVVSGDDAMLDRDILDRLDAPLMHLLRNALDHGLETPEERSAAGKPAQGSLRITARPHAGMLMIEIADDGRGIDLERIRARLRQQPAGDGLATPVAALTDDELLEQLFVPGFSLSERVTEISGRGVGLDVVRTTLHEIDGSVRVSTRAGAGTSFHLLVPTSRVVVRTVVVDVAGECYGFPLSRIRKLVRVRGDALRADAQAHHTHADGMHLRLFGLAGLLELGPNDGHGEELTAVVVEQQGHACGFVVRQVLGEFDLSVRPLDARLGRIGDVSCAAVLPDGQPVILLDVDDLLRNAQRPQGRARLSLATPRRADRRRRVLVVDDSISVRELERHLLMGAGFEVDVAMDGADAWNKVRERDYDLVVTDVDMPRMDGIALTRSIKQDAALGRVPVVIVSYRDRPEDRARGLEARADRYVTKSDFQDDNFLALVRDLLAEHAELEAAA